MNVPTSPLLYIGKRAGGSLNFIGDFAAVAFYNAALTSTRIRAHFDAAAPPGLGIRETQQEMVILGSWGGARQTQSVRTVVALTAPPPPTVRTVLVAHPDNTRVLDLGTSSSVPSNWYTAGFDDSAWATPRSDTVYGPDWITIPSYSPTVPNYALFRWRTFISVPTGGIISLIVGETHANDDFLECWINGVRVSELEETAGGAGPVVTADVSGYLSAGANLIAFKTDNTSGFGASDFTSHAKLTVDVQVPTLPVLWKGIGTWFLLNTTDPYVYWGGGAFQSDSAKGALVFWDNREFTE
jgi:hypothetical protein